VQTTAPSYQTTSCHHFTWIKEVLELKNKIDVGESTIIGDNVIYGQDVSIGEFCVIGDNVVFGDFVKVGNYCEIHNDCRIGDSSTLGSRCILRKGVKINDRVHVGPHAVIQPLITMETNSILKSMSVLLDDVEAHEVWDGIPAIMVRLIKGSEIIV